jgi:hypothetical protein
LLLSLLLLLSRGSGRDPREGRRFGAIDAGVGVVLHHDEVTEKKGAALPCWCRCGVGW